MQRVLNLRDECAGHKLVTKSFAHCVVASDEMWTALFREREASNIDMQRLQEKELK